ESYRGRRTAHVPGGRIRELPLHALPARSIMRRMICFLLVGALSIPALVGCSGNSSPDQATGGSAKVVQPRTSIDCAIEGGTTAVAVADDGKVVITQGYGKAKNVQVWDVKKQQKLHEFDNASGSVLPVAIAPDGKTCAYTTYHAVSLREVGTGKE